MKRCVLHLGGENDLAHLRFFDPFSVLYVAFQTLHLSIFAGINSVVNLNPSRDDSHNEGGPESLYDVRERLHVQRRSPPRRDR